MNDLTDSARRFKEKKDKCVDFVSGLEKLAENYEKDFPAPEKKDEATGPTRSQIFAGIANRLRNDKLKILVAGQFKQGKSTLINALLGEEVLPAYSTPCTAVITEIAYGERKKAVISFKEEIMGLPKGISPKTVAHIGSKRKNIPDLVIESDDMGDELDEYLVIPDEEDKEQRESVAESPYSCCRLTWPLELCKNEVEIIDSPGLNEATARDETTYKYVPEADMILHVLSALQLFGKPDQDFLQKLESMGAPSTIFLVNRFDQLNSAKEQDRVRARAMKELPDYTEYDANGIFFVSSYKALNAREENNEDLYKESGFPKFEKQLAKIIEKDRVKMKLTGNLKGACGELEVIAYKFLPDLRRKLDSNVQELEKKYEASQKEFAKLDERRDRIGRTIEKGMGQIKKMLHSELRVFFRDFASDSLEEYIQDVPITINKFLDKQESVNRAVRELSVAALGGLETALHEFNKRKADDIEDIISEMKESIQEQLEDFNDLLDAIRVDMDMDNNKSLALDGGRVQGIGIDDVLGEALGGAIVGGVGGAGAVWAGAQFIAMLGGPVGWGIAVAAAIGSALLALFSSTSAEDKVKDQFVKEAARKIRADSDAWAKELSESMSEGLNKQKQLFMDQLNRKIADTRGPIEEAINMLKKDQDNIGQKKQLLEDYEEKFRAALEQGKQLMQAM